MCYDHLPPRERPISSSTPIQDPELIQTADSLFEDYSDGEVARMQAEEFEDYSDDEEAPQITFRDITENIAEFIASHAEGFIVFMAPTAILEAQHNSTETIPPITTSEFVVSEVSNEMVGGIHLDKSMRIQVNFSEASGWRANHQEMQGRFHWKAKNIFPALRSYAWLSDEVKALLPEPTPEEPAGLGQTADVVDRELVPGLPVESG
ncbi:hypothetical protein B0T25DRAFT_608164 [Lasiosphaeria hispida]|uniref:Uncharacterized protein n=1 Tax=Lasiosphaeria hispida TaxID=260671 RepID=A0AAJ0MEP4_9PEZI|nr:hypothetical protein B0T25DRAFT_608164 [Lasiosphaeria hispida]